MNISSIEEQSTELNPDVYLTKEEIAARLRLTPRTVNEWMAKDILPYYKLGRTVRFRWEEVREAHVKFRKGGKFDAKANAFS